MTISEAQDYFKSNYYCELIDANPLNRNLIKSFQPNAHGARLADYLKQNAWSDHVSGEKRVYLVKTNEGELVAYFTLKCGLLFKEHSFQTAESEETSDAFATLIDAYDNPDTYANVVDSIYAVFDEPISKQIEKEVEEKLELKKRMEENPDSRQVKETFSAIELVHFCKNSAFNDTNLELHSRDGEMIPFGFYLFWELIIPTIQSIINYVGCSYLYLFAADHDEENQKLRRHYRQNCGFKDSDSLLMLVPEYDKNCYPLIQPAGDLSKKRDDAWQSRADFFDDED